MALNALGLGIVFTASNLASEVIKSLARDFKDLDGTVDIGGKRISASLIQVGAGVAALGAGAAGLAGLKVAADAAGDFEAAIAKSAVTANLTAKQTRVLSKEVFRLSQTFGRDLIETAEGAFPIVSANFTETADVAKVFEASLKLATAGFSDLASATRAVIGLTVGFGEGAEGAARAADLLAVAAGRSQADVAQFAQALPRAISLSAEFGVGQDELVAALSAVTGTTKNAAESITAIRGALIAIVRGDAGKAAETAERLGIEFGSTALKAKGFAAILEDIKNKIGDDTTALRTLFPDVEGLEGILALTGSQAENFAQTLELVRNSAGAADRGVAKVSKTFNFLKAQAKATGQVLKVRFGDAAIPLFGTFSKIMIGLGKIFDNISDSTIRFIVKIVELGSVLLIAVGGGLILNVVKRFWPAIIKIIGGGAATIAAALLPIIIVTLKIAAVMFLLKLAFQKNFLGIRTILKSAITVFQILFEAFRTGGNLSEEASEKFLMLSPPIQNLILTLFAAGERIRSFFRGVIDTLRPIVGELFGPIGNALKSLVFAAIDFVDSILGIFGVGTLMKDLFAVFFSEGTTGFRDMGQTIGIVAGFIANVLVKGIELSIGALRILVNVLTLIAKAIGIVFAPIRIAISGLSKLARLVTGGGIRLERPEGFGGPAPIAVPQLGGGPRAATALGGGGGIDADELAASLGAVIEDRPLEINLNVDGETLEQVSTKARTRRERRRARGVGGSF